MKIKASHLFALVILTVAWWLVAGLMWGSPSPGELIVLTIVTLVFASALVLTARKTSPRVWGYTGLLILAGLFLPASVLAKIFPDLLSLPLDSLLLTIPVALVVAALLLYSGLNLHRKWKSVGLEEDEVSQAQRKHTGRASVVVLVLSALLLAKAIHNLYWVMVWDTTDDSLGYFWLVFPVLAVLFSSVLLFIILPGRAKMAGFLYLLLIPALIAVSTRAQSVDFRQLTEERVGRVSQAIESYYAREGRYPQELRQLTPFYVLSLPGPVVIYGQDWCYEGGKDYYRLGYLDREHWSSPILFGRVHSAKGRSSLEVDVCQSAIDTYRAQHPDWDWLQYLGSPTPTPGIGE